MESKKIAIGSDHAGYEMKEFLVGYLGAVGYEVFDFGCYSPESCDYPDVMHPMAEAIENGGFMCGVAMCGSGNGVAMTLNKHQDIRAAICWNKELAELARQHNNANVCVLPARFIDNAQASEIVDAYLAASFEGGRHERRVKKIPVKCCKCEE